MITMLFCGSYHRSGAYFWFVFSFTGVDGFINGVNNL
jgi:hypothetical protein